MYRMLQTWYKYFKTFSIFEGELWGTTDDFYKHLTDP